MVRIAVLGCGLMGIKIAGELAYHGHRVKLYDSNVSALNSAYSRIEEDKKYLREEGLLPQHNFVGQILCLSRLEETVRDAEFIFECVIDDLKIKQDLFERVSHCCPPDAVICTNTLRVDGTAISERTTYQQRTIGVRFLYPVYYIPEVEITPNKNTSAEAIQKVRSLCERMGKTLFFRSGGEPLILTEEQREARKTARVEQLRNPAGMGNMYGNAIPSLSNPNNNHSSIDDDNGSHHYNVEADRDCAICMDRERDCLLCPCHHMVTCSQCAKSLHNRRDGCPICRTGIQEIIRIYHS